MSRELQPCGTRTAYMRHLKDNEEPCALCREVNRAYNRDYMRRRYAGRLGQLPRTAPEGAHRAPCFGDTTGMWDAQGEGEPLEQARVRWGRAARLCQRCPVLEHCEASAGMAGGSGVWAGVVL